MDSTVIPYIRDKIRRAHYFGFQLGFYLDWGYSKETQTLALAPPPSPVGGRVTGVAFEGALCFSHFIFKCTGFFHSIMTFLTLFC